MNTDSRFEKKYYDLVAGLEKIHKRNVSKTRSALKSLLIVPTIFLILLFMTNSSKTVFLVLWIASMFVIASILIIIEYQDYLLRKMFSDVNSDESGSAASAILSDGDELDASQKAEKIRRSVRERAPEKKDTVSSKH